MDLPALTLEAVQDKAVLVRVDAEIEGNVSGQRMLGIEQMAKWLITCHAGKIKLIGHNGHGQVQRRLASWWGNRLEIDEDLRADPREKANSSALASELARGFAVYINDSFSESHREYTSVNALPKYMKQHNRPVFAGLRLTKEIEMLSKVFNTPGSMRLLIIGGAKAKDKAKLADELAPKFDQVLLGGTLADAKSLRSDGLDLADVTISRYIQIISRAQVIVVAGPLGKFEDPACQKGTGVVFNAVAYSKAYKVAGGGSTEAAIRQLGLEKKFDWISVGGGAMLQFLAKGTLPGIQALLDI